MMAQNAESDPRTSEAIPQLSVLSTLPKHWRSLPRAFVNQARKRRTHTAVSDASGESLTYVELFERAVALGQVLDRPLGSESYVGLILPPSAVGAVANLAISLRGKIPVNLNYTAGQHHVDAAIRRCGIRHIVTSRRVMERLAFEPAAELIHVEDLPPKVTWVDKLWATIIARVVPIAWLGSFLPGLRGDRLEATAAVLFTSGTTGDPKGVVLTHGNVLSNIRQLELQLEPSPDEVVLGILPFFHAMGHTINLWAVLCLGRKAVFHSNPLEGQVVGDLCRRHGVTLIFATPTFMRLYLKRCSQEQLASVRRVALGAEKLGPELAREIRQKLSVEPMEGYGCTELSPVAAFNVDHDIRTTDGRTIAGNRKGTVGQPLPETLIKTVCLDTGAELPPGSEGIVCIKGPQVMAGYLDQPAETANVIKDGWFITGDIGHVDEEGFLVIVGRLARFSKIGGEMVPHERIEAIVRDSAGVNEHALIVIAVPDHRRGERLVVLYTDLGGKSPEEVFKILIAKDIPRLWIPAAEDYLKIEAIPLLGNGKVDLGQLRKIAQSQRKS